MLILRLFVRLLFIMSMWKWLLPDISSALSMCVKMHITFQKFCRFFFYLYYFTRVHFTLILLAILFLLAKLSVEQTKTADFLLEKNSEYPNIKEYFKSNFGELCIFCAQPSTHLPLAYRNTQFASETGWDWAKR